MARKDELTERVRRDTGKTPAEILAELERHVRSPRKRPGAHFGRVYNVTTTTVPVAATAPPPPTPPPPPPPRLLMYVDGETQYLGTLEEWKVK